MKMDENYKLIHVVANRLHYSTTEKLIWKEETPSIKLN